MAKKGLLIAATVVLMAPHLSIAGGSSEVVSVKSLSLYNETEFVLVVAPRPNEYGYEDPYMSGCHVFTVLGAFENPQERLTKEGHLAALALLAKAKRDDVPVHLGWMGTGFVKVNDDEPCVVRSRGLRILTGSDGEKHIVSYHS